MMFLIAKRKMCTSVQASIHCNNEEENRFVHTPSSPFAPREILYINSSLLAELNLPTEPSSQKVLSIIRMLA